MTMRRGFLTLAVLVLAVPAVAQTEQDQPRKRAAAQSATGGAEIGAAAPDFTLKDLDGKEVSLSSFKGKVVVLEWVNHECPVCVRHCKEKTATNVMEKFKGKPVVWLGIDSSHFCETKAESIKKWHKEQNLPYTILLDAPGMVGKLYTAKTTPHMFVIDQKGVLAYMGAMDDDPQGTNKEKKNYVEEAVNALLNGSTVATTTTQPYGCSVKYKPTTAG